MRYEEPEMEVIEFNGVQTVVDASQFGNGGAGATTPTDPDVDLGFN